MKNKLNELSPTTLSSYKKKAGAAASAADKAGKYDLGHKRFKGIVKATKKEFDKDTKKIAEGVVIRRSAIMEGIEQVDEINWRKAAATGAMALGALGALGGAGGAHAADFTKFNTEYLQQVAAGTHPRPWISADDARQELARRAGGGDVEQQQVVQQIPGKGFSKEYLERAADPDRVGRYMISVERAQELLKKMQDGN